MRSVITQSVVLPATPDTLFDSYLDPSQHAAFTGHPVAIAAETGAEFRAFDGQLSGRILAVVRPNLIVQSWRSVNFLPEDEDSTLILEFLPVTDGTRVELVQVGVPRQDYNGVSEGWQQHYWEPWKTWLQDQP